MEFSLFKVEYIKSAISIIGKKGIHKIQNVIFDSNLIMLKKNKKDQVGLTPTKLFRCIYELCLLRTIFMQYDITFNHRSDG